MEVTVEFICPDEQSLTQQELEPLEHAAYGIQLASRIVDTPCNEMHTDAFVEVCENFIVLKFKLQTQVFQILIWVTRCVFCILH